MRSFERKLVTHMAKGFDPFKPLSINTAASDSALIVKKPIALYETAQRHQHHALQPASSVVDGQQSSRMEIHKATLASTVDYESYQPRLSSIKFNLKFKYTLH